MAVGKVEALKVPDHNGTSRGLVLEGGLEVVSLISVFSTVDGSRLD